MDRLSRAIRARLDDQGMSARAAALASDLPIRAVQGVIEGHVPSVDRADEICRALGIEFRIGPRRDGPTSVKQALQIQKPALPPAPPRALESGLERVRDRDLAALLAAVAARWRALPEAERRYLLSDLWAAGGSGLRAQGSGIEGAVAWLGWRVIDGAGADEEV